jgi:hypothetical protein
MRGQNLAGARGEPVKTAEWKLKKAGNLLVPAIDEKIQVHI